MKKISKQISLGYDPITGKRIRKRIYADSKAGLKQAEKDAIREYAKSGAPSQVKYKDFEKKWFAAYKSNVQPHTQTVYKGALKFAAPLHQKKMKDITRTDLQKTVNEVWDRPATCKLYVQLLHNMWGVAVGDGVCTKDVTIGLRTPKYTQKSRRPFTEEELDGISKAEFDPLERFLVDILLQFGLRPGEAFALNKHSFNRKARTLMIDKGVAYNSNNPYIKSTKTGVTRVLPVPDSFWEKIPKLHGIYWFTEKDGSLLTKMHRYNMTRSIINKINEAMGGTDKLKKTDLTLYTFRHHRASLLYYLPGVSIKKKAEYMGHSETMFLKIYSHMMEGKEDSEALRAAINL